MSHLKKINNWKSFPLDFYRSVGSSDLMQLRVPPRAPRPSICFNPKRTIETSRESQTRPAFNDPESSEYLYLASLLTLNCVCSRKVYQNKTQFTNYKAADKNISTEMKYTFICCYLFYFTINIKRKVTDSANNL